ncbi:MAG: amidoligase family protein [Alphaproteobacteria bacterium]|nr:amidoligase family protein [Alphaproteobacteria bacterium]
MPVTPWRLGVEVELLAPPGRSRADLAEALAQAAGGRVRRFFHPQSEPAKVPGQPVFRNLTPGFEALDAEDRPIAACVDDLTLQEDLDRLRAPRDGWLRVVSDDARLLRLVARHGDPDADLPEAIAPVAALFGTAPEAGPGGMWRVQDSEGASICIGAPLPGERERPCEVVTPPLEADRGPRLRSILETARALGFTAPVEGATHLHFDAAPLRSASAVAALIRWWQAWRMPMRRLLDTNPRCRRLGPLPDAVVALGNDPAFAALSWPEARQRLVDARPTKFLDLNLRNLALELPGKTTVELRILPVHLDATPILQAAALFEQVLRRAVEGAPLPGGPTRPPGAVPAMLEGLELPAQAAMQTG